MADESDVISEGYVFRRGEVEEERRLEAQARVIDPLTERLFRSAGLDRGMRVLEFGSGAGDVSMLAARIVGPEGAVVGLDSSREALATARQRARQAGFANVTLHEGDVHEPAGVLDARAPPFDAVVGRLILQFAPDPALVVRSACELVRPGGLVCFQEGDDWYTWAYPTSPLWEQVRGWILAALQDSHVEQRMGLRLYQTFLAAGLPAPELRLEAAIGGGERAPVSLWADLVRVLSPVLERLGIATAAETDAATLAERLLAETLARDGVVIALPLIGAWTRTPTGDDSVTREDAQLFPPQT